MYALQLIILHWKIVRNELTALYTITQHLMTMMLLLLLLMMMTVMIMMMMMTTTTTTMMIMMMYTCIIYSHIYQCVGT